MKKLKIVECFIEDRAFKASDGRLYYVKAEENNLQIISKQFEIKVDIKTDAGNKEESAHWLLKNNTIYFKSKDGLQKVAKQFTKPTRDYQPEPLIACDLAFYCYHPRFVHCLPYGAFEHDYIVLKAKGDGTYEDISKQFKKGDYWYIRSVSTCSSCVIVQTKMDAIDCYTEEFNVKFNPTELSRRKYEVEKLVNVDDSFSKEERDKLRDIFKNLL